MGRQKKNTEKEIISARDRKHFSLPHFSRLQSRKPLLPSLISKCWSIFHMIIMILTRCLRAQHFHCHFHVDLQFAVVIKLKPIIYGIVWDENNRLVWWQLANSTSRKGIHFLLVYAFVVVFFSCPAISLNRNLIISWDFCVAFHQSYHRAIFFVWHTKNDGFRVVWQSKRYASINVPWWNHQETVWVLLLINTKDFRFFSSANLSSLVQRNDRDNILDVNKQLQLITIWLSPNW